MSRPRPRVEVGGSGPGWDCLGPQLGGGWGSDGGCPDPHLGGVSRPTPGGMSRPTSRGSRSRGGVSQHALRQTPPCRQILLRAVCILLECIFVAIKIPNECYRNQSPFWDEFHTHSGFSQTRQNWLI